MRSSISTSLKYYSVYKPFGMLSQFTAEAGRESLKALHDFAPDVYPIGRLDADSEGLLLLSNDKFLTNRLLSPKFQHKRTYLVQVDNDITEEACKKLEQGIAINIDGSNYKTIPCEVRKISMPEGLPERNPPVRFRKAIPTSWIEITLTEGKNRQVRKMTAAVGFPTLRLIRTSIEDIKLEKMLPKDVREFSRQDMYRLLKIR